MKLFIIFMILFPTLFLCARENPFQPVRAFESESLTKPIPVPDLEPKITITVKENVKCQAPQTEEIFIKEQTVENVWKNNTIEPPKREIRETKPKRTKKIFIKYHPIYKDENLKIYTKRGYIKIVTKEKIRKSFALFRPNRLVIDFNDNFYIYDSIKKRIKRGYIKELKLGTHESFFRLTFVLKPGVSGKVQKRDYGYLIKLR